MVDPDHLEQYVNRIERWTDLGQALDDALTATGFVRNRDGEGQIFVTGLHPTPPR